MNILIAQDAQVASDWKQPGWAASIGLFGGRLLLKQIAQLATIQNNVDDGEYYDQAIKEAAYELIGTQSDRRITEGSPRSVDDADRETIADYLLHCVKALRPYMPSSGSIELVTYLTDPKHHTLYLVVRYWPEDEYSDKAFSGPSVRG